MIKIKEGFYFIGIIWFILLMDILHGGDDADVDFFDVEWCVSVHDIIWSYTIKYLSNSL